MLVSLIKFGISFRSAGSADICELPDRGVLIYMEYRTSEMNAHLIQAHGEARDAVVVN